MHLNDLAAHVEAIAADDSLLEERRLMARADAMDYLLMVRQTSLRHLQGGKASDLRALKRRAAALIETLEALDAQLFERIRGEIRRGALRGEALRRYLSDFTAYPRGSSGHLHLSHEGADVLLSSVWETAPEPEWPSRGDPDLVHYEPAPASVILELVDRVRPGEGQVFYDLGSGLGRAVILYHLLTELPARGIEIEASYWAYARGCALSLGLSQVRFELGDAREVSLAEGTIFFLFTPFVGEVLQTVLRRLRWQAQDRPLLICSYGPCTPLIARQTWLHSLDAHAQHEFKLALFAGA